jgi:hypothetical protein
MSRNMLNVEKLATCKRCGDSQCAWLQNKQGKWYLVSAYVVADTHGTQFQAAKMGYHKCQPKPVAPHACIRTEDSNACTHCKQPVSR